jgi:hypothetical protein
MRTGWGVEWHGKLPIGDEISPEISGPKNENYNQKRELAQNEHGVRGNTRIIDRICHKS